MLIGYYYASMTLYDPLKWLPAIPPNLCNSTYIIGTLVGMVPAYPSLYL
jgi:hypothetical protein